MSLASVAVVILNYNGQSFLEKFLPGVVRHSPGAQIIVADNGSTDHSIAFLQNYFPEITVIGLGKNEGFCRGYNRALKQVDASLYVLLNSDVEVTPGWLAPLVNRMNEDDRVGACQPKIKAYAQHDFFEYAGAAGGWIDKWGYPFCRGRIFEAVEKDEGQYNDTVEVFWASGACMMIRSELYHRLGGLDEDFFAHMEEIDLCWRIKHAGYRVLSCGDTEVYHVGGGTLPKSNPRKTFLNFRNSLAALYKNLSGTALFPTLLIRLVLDGVAGAKFLVDGKAADCWAVVQAHFSFYRWLPDLHRKRRANQVLKEGGALAENQVGVYSKSIVFAYFIRQKRTFTQLFS